jgi:Mg-chelatase subunit ChlD
MVTFASDGSSNCGMVSTASSLDQPLTTALNLISDAMQDYKDGIWFGGTNITAGLHAARIHMESAADLNRDRFIIVFTDGQHNTSVFPFDEATLCANAGIVVHTITFSDDANTADMITTASNGGGEHYHAVETEELKDIFRRLAGSFAILTE